MVNQIFQRRDDLIELNFKEREDYISCQVFYSLKGDIWSYASIYPDISSKFVLDGCAFLWDQGQTIGTARLHDKEHYSVYWNFFLDLGAYVGTTKLKILFITAEGFYEEEYDIEIKDNGVKYLYDWETYLGQDGSSNPQEWEDKWYINRESKLQTVNMKYKKKLPTILIPVDTEGYYDIYIGIRYGNPRFLIKIGDEKPERLLGQGDSMSLYKSNYASKSNKEILWKTVDIKKDTVIEISQLQETINSHLDMGSISYIKLVPVGKPSLARNRRVYNGELILYYEPYSYTLHGFHDSNSMNSTMLEEFMRLNPREITCQTVRIGSKCLHHSSLIEHYNKPAKTDNQTVIDDPMKLVSNCDILAETTKYIAGKAIRLTANIGMNRPYLGIPELSEKFTRENAQLIRYGYFDYAEEKVQEYALKIIYEIIDNYDIDGIVLDYMRSYNNQKIESLVHIVSKTRDRLDSKERIADKKLELKVRIPADQIIYYRAMDICVENRYVDGIIPSNLVTGEPLPPVEHYIELCRGTGTKVYGCIDGWKYNLGYDQRAGSICSTYIPEDIEKYIEYYSNLDVDGIFIYQADQITSNPYINKLFY